METARNSLIRRPLSLDIYRFVAGGAVVAADVVPQQDRVVLVGRRESSPPLGSGFAALRRPADAPETPVAAWLFAAQ